MSMKIDYVDPAAIRAAKDAKRKAREDLRGPRGYEGLRGKTGQQGPPGEDGKPGNDGLDGERGAQGKAGPRGASGDNGWSPVLSVVSSGARRVLRVSNWVGGSGEPPESGLYIGPDGLTDDIRKAVDVRGPKGAQGFTGQPGVGIRGPRGLPGEGGSGAGEGGEGWSPVLAVAPDGERRVLQVSDWTGGTGDKPDTGLYVGATGLVSDIADAVDVRGAAGGIGDKGPTGDQGPVGEQGPIGDQGPDGDQGPAGDQGPVGDQGPQGEPGIPGTTPAFSVYRSADQTIGNAAFVKVLFDAELFDTDGEFDVSTAKWTPKTPGKYIITVGCLILSTTARVFSCIYKNGVITKGSAAYANGTNNGPSCSAVVDMNGTTDYLEFYTYQESGSSKTLLGSSAWTFATGALIGVGAKGDAGPQGIPGDDNAVIEYVIDGSGSAISTGMKGYLEVPFACSIERASLLADRSGSIVVDVFKCSYANFNPGTHPVAADKITASAPPTISSGVKSQDSTLTGWTKSIGAGDVLGFNVNSASTIQRVTLSLKVGPP